MTAFLPALRSIPQRHTTLIPLGYDRRPAAREGTFFDMANLTGAAYPFLRPRARRARQRLLEKPNGLLAHEKLCWVDGTTFFYDGKPAGQVTDGEKQLIAMGARVLIWPDKRAYNTQTGEMEDLQARFTTTGTVTARLARPDGEEYASEPAVGDTPPEEPVSGDLWLDTSQTPHLLRIYSAYAGLWQTVPTVCVRISAPGIGAPFAPGDGVTLSGFEDEALNGDFTLTGAGTDFLLVTALLRKTLTQESPVTVERPVPDMDYLTVCDNRLWGCSSAAHEIYASALGNPAVWRRFQGVSTDSFALSVGDPGPFTGAATHQGFVLFFKENAVYKVYGSRPANYQLTVTRGPGVRQGSALSLCTAGQTLFYLSPCGVCAYGAALPTPVGDALGDVRYHGAVGGALDGLVYLSLRDSRDRLSLFCYDPRKEIWHRQDGPDVIAFAAYGDDLYFLDRRDGGLWTVSGRFGPYADDDAQLEEPLAWFAQTGDLGLAPGGRAVTALRLGLRTRQDALVRVLVRYDSETDWHEAARVQFPAHREATIPVPPRRHDTLQILLAGHGDVEITYLDVVSEG